MTPNPSDSPPQSLDFEGKLPESSETSVSLDKITGTENNKVSEAKKGTEVDSYLEGEKNTIGLNKLTETSEKVDRPPIVPKLLDFNPAKWQEFTRIYLVGGLVFNILLTIFMTASFIFIPMFSSKKNTVSSEKNENLIKLDNQTAIYLVQEDKDKGSRELINLLWTSQMTLLSGAIGFYFGSKNFTKD